MGEIKKRESNFYDTTHLAEYYDLWCYDYSQDSELYLTAFKQCTALWSAVVGENEPFRILEIGSGTGRVLINLIRDAGRDNISLANVHYIGVDKESSMVQHAQDVQRKSSAMEKVGRIDFVHGEASNLTAAPLLQNLFGQVDMLLFPIASISHLVEPYEHNKFLAQVSTLLRPGSGRAYISLGTESIASRSITDGKIADSNFTDMIEAQEFQSKLYDGVFYKQFPNERSYMEGPLKIEHFRVQVIRKTETGDHEVIEDNAVKLRARMWDEQEFLNWASEAGLNLSETSVSSHETNYVFNVVESAQPQNN